jgi:aminoglycoside phosphotransferase (APT) family kinase protein
MKKQEQNTTLIEPPVETPGLKLGSWIPLSSDDPIVDHLTKNLWKSTEYPERWEVARRSRAVYVFREVKTRWQAAAKFYIVKTGDSAEKNARRELALIEPVRQASLSTGNIRAIKAYGVWRGALFLEFVDGLTLEDVIAVRRSRPGTVLPCLGKIAQFFALLHSQTVEHSDTGNRDDFTVEARKIVDNLTRYGVLKGNPIIQDGLICQFRRWAEKPEVHHYTPALNHGDATTTNFIFPIQGDELVAIDWERSRVMDPAADLGRIMAEIEHSISQHGGDQREGQPIIQHLAKVYTDSVSNTIDAEALFERARYYRAITSLRIARNGWLSRLERTRLVAQAQALLV